MTDYWRTSGGRFIGHPDAGQRSAILYSLIVSCQRHGKGLLARLPAMSNRDDLKPLLPCNSQPAPDPVVVEIAATP